MRVPYYEPPEEARVPEPPCPYCGREILVGDGEETPPFYCPHCDVGWASPDDIPIKEEADGLPKV